MTTNFARRKLLKNASALTCGGLLHSAFRPVNNWFAWAGPGSERAAFSSNPVLIVINMAGGASYNVAPLFDGTYRDKNKVVSYGPEQALAFAADQGIHPSLTGFKTVADMGNLALLNLVGYPNPNRSHDESTDIWFRGVRQGMNSVSGGWAARMTGQLGQMFSGISLAGSNLLIQGDVNPPRAIQSLDSLGEANFLGSDIGALLRLTRDNMMVAHRPPPNSEFGNVKSQMDQVQASLALLKQQTNVTLPTVANPLPQNMSGFQRACRDAATLLAAPALQTKFIYMERGGFDTHSDERARLAGNLTDMNAGITYLVQVAQALGRWNDVMIVTMSEFCRTFENGSRGTDHGHAAPMYIMGGRVAGGQKSPAPTPQQTAERDFYRDHSVDFRQVFYEIVKSMGLNADAIFPEKFSFTSLNLFN